MGMMTRGYAVMIALDQLLNAVCGGWPDETISSRAYRWHRDGVRHWPCRLLDFLLGAEHCADSYESEWDRNQLPPEFRR